MALLDGGLDRKLGGRRGVEIVFYVGFQGRLVALEGEHVIGLVGNDPVGDVDLTTHGVDGHQRALELLGGGDVSKKSGMAVNFVVFSGKAGGGGTAPRRSRVGAERVQGFEPIAA